MQLNRTLSALAVLVIGAGLAWLAGWNFDTRGFFEAFYTAIVLFIAGMIYTCPLWDD